LLALSLINAGSWAARSLLLVFALCYNLTVGTVTYSLVSEVSSVRLRAKALSLARNLYNVCSIVSGVIAPYMLNPTAWNWKNKSGFFWAGITFVCLVWAFFRVPETKGRTYAELDVLFEKGVGARNFAGTPVEVIECHRAVVAEKEQQS
jgi:SP family general alpha glucoside:H+ symporter-like MFS transporter